MWKLGGEALLDRLSLASRLRGTGQLSSTAGAVRVSFTLEGSQHNESTPWRLEAHVPSGSDEPAMTGILDTEPGPTLRGKTESGAPITIPVVQSWHRRGSALTAEVREFHVGDEGECEGATYRAVELRLTETPLARDNFAMVFTTDDGLRATPEGAERVHQQEIPLSCGTARLERLYDWVHAESPSGAKTPTAVSSPVLVLGLDSPQRPDLAWPTGEIEAEVEAVLDVLSLLSRRYVRWHRMTLKSNRRSGDQWCFATRERIRTITGSRADAYRGAFANTYRMPPGALARLVATFRGDPERNLLRSAIVYSIAVYEGPQLETSFTNAFVALEALLAAHKVAPARDDDASIAKAVRKRLKNQVRAFCTERALGSKAAGDFIRRFVSAPVAPAADRAARMIADLGVHWLDLFPAGADLGQALQNAFRRRNMFLHRGELPDDGLPLYADARRLRFLAERLCYQRLGGESDWLAPSGDVHELRFLQQAPL